MILDTLLLHRIAQPSDRYLWARSPDAVNSVSVPLSHPKPHAALCTQRPASI